MKTKVLFLAGLSLFFTQVISAQKVAFALSDNQLHVIQRITDRSAIIYFEGEEKELPLNTTKMVLSDVPDFLPGYVKTENVNVSMSDFDEQNRNIADTHVFVYEADIIPDRTLENAFISYMWVRPDKSTYLVSVPIDNVKAGEKEHVRHRFYVLDRFVLLDPSIHYMTMGFEVPSSKDMDQEPKTPYQIACEKTGMASLPDGNLKPISMVPNPPINDAEGNPRNGFVHLRMSIDENGYVTAIKPVKYSEWVFAKAVQMTAPFFMFQPKVQDGSPVPTAVTVPFKF